jgi:hypothetical protein
MMAAQARALDYSASTAAVLIDLRNGTATGFDVGGTRSPV